MYVTYTVWNAAGQRDTALWKETRCDPWGSTLCPFYPPQKQPLAGADVTDASPGLARVTGLSFQYFDVNGQTIPTTLPAPATPSCPSTFPAAQPRRDYALDGQGAVAGGTIPSPVQQQPPTNQRDMVRTIRVQITVESNIAYDTTSGCFRRDVGGPSQAFSLVTEAYLRGPTP
jgi:hypothetical protein